MHEFNYPQKLAGMDIIVEAAHIYSDETPGQLHWFSSQVGGLVKTVLANFGANAQGVLFIDNYNVDEHTLDVAKYERRVIDAGFTPDLGVLYEADLVGGSLKLLEKLPTIVEGDLVKLQHNSVPLYNKEKQKPLCALLDATLYATKLDAAEMAVTVLDSKWKSQQRNTLRVLSELGYDSHRVSNVYVKGESVNISSKNQLDTALALVAAMVKAKVTPK